MNTGVGRWVSLDLTVSDTGWRPLAYYQAHISFDCLGIEQNEQH